MLNILIVSNSEKTSIFLQDFFNSEADVNITICRQATKARHYSLDASYDLTIINYPMIDDTNYNLAFDLIEKQEGSVIVFIPNEAMDRIASRFEKAGIFTLGKPINKSILYQVLKYAIISQRRITKIQSKTKNLANKLQEIKIIDRAKCLLIEREGISEQEAHRYLEKKAMDSQLPRLYLAKMIINKYMKQ